MITNCDMIMLKEMFINNRDLSVEMHVSLLLLAPVLVKPPWASVFYITMVHLYLLFKLGVSNFVGHWTHLISFFMLIWLHIQMTDLNLNIACIHDCLSNGGILLSLSFLRFIVHFLHIVSIRKFGVVCKQFSLFQSHWHELDKRHCWKLKWNE